jgi:hypothetical protein
MDTEQNTANYGPIPGVGESVHSDIRQHMPVTLRYRSSFGVNRRIFPIEK